MPGFCYVDYFNRNKTGDKSKDTSAILSIEGRQHPVDILYKKEPASNYVYAALDTVIDIHKNLPPGMLLQFRLIMFPLF